MFYYVEYALVLMMSLAFGKKNRKIALLLFIAISFIFVFRYSELSDLIAYRAFYDNILIPDISDRFAFEPIFYGICKFFSRIGFSFDAFITALYIFYFYMFWKATKFYSEDIGVALMVASFYMIYPAMGGLRQGICLLLYFYATRYLTIENDASGNKKNSLRMSIRGKYSFSFTNDAKFLLISFLCVFIHRTALFLFVIYFFRKPRVKKYIITFSLLISMVWPYAERLIQRFPYFNGKYQYYKADLEANGYGTLLSFRLMEYVIVFLVVLLKKEKDTTDKLTLDLVELGLIVQVFFSRLFSASYRFLQYTDIALILFVLMICKSIREIDVKYGFIVFIAIYIFCRFYRLDVVSFDPNWHFAFM